MASSGRDADACSDDFARGTVDPERSDLFSKIRKDFDAAGVAQSDEQILRIMTKLMLKGGELHANNAARFPRCRSGDAHARSPVALRSAVDCPYSATGC
ncbi:hypothetical protein [Bosea sp. NBC_00550]|uniref:hypothetical protein n=1 Tax=Bosea sp. NBC_00550 TaxID=2969621 RepID=UPI002230AEF4|nr:hypothetical protein [Bosea sp. NBC_00550]UZF91600.1 hypothetical protein NWE53_21175 [Bosea sp. NBC_00550]